MHPMLTIAVKAARKAGVIINRSCLELEKIKVSCKGPKNYVTEIDQLAEKAIVEILKESYPSHSFLGEEFGNYGSSKSDFLWIIDPIDGTTNFIHGFPNYAVSIALSFKDKIIQAVIYDPSRDELFTASRGSGAFLNNRRIRVSKQNILQYSLLGMHCSTFSKNDVENKFNILADECTAVRRMGSTVIDLAYVACGRLDGFCGINLKPWDLAAGSLIVTEAGGLVSDYFGEQEWMNSGNIIAATPKIFSKILNKLNN
ncbi:Inositol-1-monophosphatase [Candidatus Kinetoplastibacterium sorsogonicusi]|uniref:Inositol-1-monophosphatase n=1 Tax=Candidatus Kinetoplastidibacterium kentomonadis TaxID=1576550 RepID=A0A3Q8ERC2_9PROT|nr:inositol monophosphatase family protein [Candidatus Kinetoplastibacterium sorsogonicusi]AWD32292.1 Inositol-1-monophosphatase [Candidatus Kinetoplastibacterium sorsogonicusi]